MDPSPARHKACDECRARKLKCTGEQPICIRCARDRVPCQYSIQKTMGRPRKRQRNEDGVANDPNDDAIGHANENAAGMLPAGFMDDFQISESGNPFTLAMGLPENIMVQGCPNVQTEWSSEHVDGNGVGALLSKCRNSRFDPKTGLAAPVDQHDPVGVIGPTELLGPSIYNTDFDFESFAAADIPCHEAGPVPPITNFETIRPDQISRSGDGRMPFKEGAIEFLYGSGFASAVNVGGNTQAPTPPGIDQNATPSDSNTWQSTTSTEMSSMFDADIGCDCLMSFFSTIVQLKKMIQNPVHLSPPTPFTSPPPALPLHKVLDISERGLEIARVALDCKSCEMCFTTIMNLGQMLGLLLRSYSQCLSSIATVATPMAVSAKLVIPFGFEGTSALHVLDPQAYKGLARHLIFGEVDKVLVLLGRMEVRSLARHGKIVTVLMTKDIAGRGIAENSATGFWQGDRNPLCLKIIGMVRGLADGLVSGCPVGSCIPGVVEGGFPAYSQALI